MSSCTLYLNNKQHVLKRRQKHSAFSAEEKINAQEKQ